MEFGIDIKTTTDGDITILDLAKDYRQYMEEEVQLGTSHDIYKYSESATLNTIIKVGTSEMKLLDVLIDNHDSEIDSCTFQVKEDGYYVVDHIVLPTLKWLEHATEEYLEYYDTVYVTDGEKLYKAYSGQLEECTVKEILERNPENTTLFKCKVDIVYTGNLQQCYFYYCQQLFETILDKCKTGDENLTFARDFIWMTLNIIDYLVCCKQYLEAQRIIETFITCNGLCNSFTNAKSKLGCGCS